jgi:restriction system protein
MSLKSFIKGWVGETVGAVAQKLLLDPKVYFSLNNITLQTEHGTTQVDHIVVSKYGIFVIEAKNIDGWIFGDAKSAQWTQSLFGKKFRFQNPLHQNYRHTKALQAFLGIDEAKLISLVMFWGDCEFKTPMPDNVRSSGYISFIKKHEAVLFPDDEVQKIVEAINMGKMPKGILKSFETRTTHLESLKDRHSSTTICPKCASALILRTLKSGQKAGSQFYGCSTFPKCRYTRPTE